MGASVIVVRHPFAKDPSEMSLVEWDQPVQALPTHRADQSLAEGVRLRRPHGRFEHPPSHRRDRPVDLGRIWRVPHGYLTARLPSSVRWLPLL